MKKLGAIPVPSNRNGIFFVRKKAMAGIMAVFLWPIAHSAGADTPSTADSPPPIMEEVVVTGRRVVDPTAQSTLILTERYADRPVTLPEILQSVAGVKISRFGGLGSFATISIRGSTADQVRFYLDGVPLNTVQGGGLDLSTIPLDLIESIEVFRGQTPAEFGQAGIGGIVDIHTRRPDGTFLTRIKTGGGSFDSLLGSAVHSGHTSGFRYLLGTDVQQTQGDFPYLDDNGTPFNQDDDDRVTRSNNESLAWGAAGRAEYELGANDAIEMAIHTHTKDQGVPGLGNFRSRTATLETARQSATLAWRRMRSGPESVEARVSGFVTLQRQSFKDTAGEIGVASQDNRDRTLGWGANGRAAMPIGERQRWTAFAEVRQEAFTPRDALFPNPLTAGRRDTMVVTLQDEVEIFPPRLLIVPSGRFEYALNRAWLVAPQTSDRVSATERRTLANPTGRLGARYKIRHDLTASANVGTAYRIPDFTELYGDRGFIQGNPDLKPESGLNADAGLLHEVPRAGVMDSLRTGIVLFGSRVTNLIQFVQNSQQTAVAENFNRVRVLGLEAQLDASLLRHAEVSTTYTHQRTTDVSPSATHRGRTVPGRPFNEVTARSGIFNAWGKVFYEFEFTEGNFLDRSNFLLVPARLIHNTGVTFKFLKRFSATAEAKNITANQLVDYNGFPLPGRSYFGSLTATF